MELNNNFGRIPYLGDKTRERMVHHTRFAKLRMMDLKNKLKSEVHLCMHKAYSNEALLYEDAQKQA